MTRIDSLLGDLLSTVQSMAITKHRLAELAQLHPNTFRSMSDKRHPKTGALRWSPAIQTVRSLEEALERDRLAQIASKTAPPLPAKRPAKSTTTTTSKTKPHAAAKSKTRAKARPPVRRK